MVLTTESEAARGAHTAAVAPAASSGVALVGNGDWRDPGSRGAARSMGLGEPGCRSARCAVARTHPSPLDDWTITTRSAYSDAHRMSITLVPTLPFVIHAWSANSSTDAPVDSTASAIPVTAVMSADVGS